MGGGSEAQANLPDQGEGIARHSGRIWPLSGHGGGRPAHFRTRRPSLPHQLSRRRSVRFARQIAEAEERTGAAVPETGEVARPDGAYRTPQPDRPNGGRRARSEGRRVGKACVSTCRTQWSPPHKNKTQNNNT